MAATDGTIDESPAAPPRQNEYPKGALIGVADDLTTAHAVLEGARDSSASEPYLIEASDVLRFREARDDDQGLLQKLYLTLGAMVSDQRTLEDRYLEEARAGHHMIVASALDDEQAERVWSACKAAGAHTGLWLSGSSLREML